MKLQPIEAQKGEIEFRRKLTQQQVDGTSLIEKEFDAKGIEKILSERMNTTLRDMRELQSQGITFSPYIEIGAERCQRSLTMENDVGASGAAIDISYDMLKSCDYYKNLFKKSKIPARIACDTNNLPFKSASLSFVFCYQTLLQFPDIGPVIREIFRVLGPAGLFFFNEEPYRMRLHVNLYKGEKKYSKEWLNRNKLRKALDRFFCKEDCNEVDCGIIDNHDVSPRAWRKALNIFDVNDVVLHSSKGINADLFRQRISLRYLLAYLFGGTISGLCRKGGDASKQPRTIYDALMCPSCRENSGENGLSMNGPTFSCPVCRKLYPNKGGVLFLFAYKKLRELYPDIYNEFRLDSFAEIRP